jgi:hypothetical protein
MNVWIQTSIMVDKDEKWWEYFDEDDEDGLDFKEPKHRTGKKLKSYYITFKDETTHSALVDGVNERDAIAQVLEEHLEDADTSDVSIISIIKVDDDEEGS